MLGDIEVDGKIIFTSQSLVNMFVCLLMTLVVTQNISCGVDFSGLGQGFNVKKVMPAYISGTEFLGAPFFFFLWGRRKPA
jgi:hypothetical protein